MRATMLEELNKGYQNTEGKSDDQDDDIFRPKVEQVIARLPLMPRIPSSTYRLQFNPAFGFDAARRIVPYLHELGITDCYCSPYLKAGPDSTHGYDVCDHNALNPAFGGEAEYEHFVQALQEHGMGQIMDFVPNHMGIGGSSNAEWMDVLENGPSSKYASFFDIDWHPLMAGEWLENKVLLPILSQSYGRVLENQELRLTYLDGAFYIMHGELVLPIAPRTQLDPLSFALDVLVTKIEAESEECQEFQSIITAVRHLPRYTDTEPEKVAERQREKEVIKKRLYRACEACFQIREAIDETIRAYNGTKGDSHSFDRLDGLLVQQPYRLAYWRVAADEINYRRFFDINDLAAIRIEVPEVFRHAHRLVFRLIDEGKVTGLRIDHPDGLWDPAGYLRALQRAQFLQLSHKYLSEDDRLTGDGQAIHTHLLQYWDEHTSEGSGRGNIGPLYIVVEKILGRGEHIPQDWPVQGTTGYEFLNAVNGLFVSSANRMAFDNIYSGFIGNRVDFSQLANTSKKMIMLISLASEVNMLGYQLKRISAKDRWYRDFTLNGLTFALREVIACLPVYRTYVASHKPAIDPQDRAYIEAAIAEAKRRNPRTAASIFDFIGDIVLGRVPHGLSEDDHRERKTFVMKLQQTTGPVMAKGIEDTAFYVYHRLTSLNEVGGNPEQFGISVAAFHRQNLERQRTSPHSLNTTSTHDTKRSEDVRARINVLSEMPREWKAALARWSGFNRDKKKLVEGKIVPDNNEEYFLYQSLLGAWPLYRLDGAARDDFANRIQAYMQKAAKEAKVNTSWINPNEAYDAALQDFVRAVLDERLSETFLTDFAVFQAKISHFAMYNSLSQTLLKIASPGVPDIYQGTEIWDFSLVDPDNRRPVDFVKRARMLTGLRQQMGEGQEGKADLASKLMATKADGRIKLYVTHLALSYRRSHERVFRLGGYSPMQIGGSRREHAIAFARKESAEVVLAVAPRLITSLTGGATVEPIDQVWEDTWMTVPRLQTGFVYRNVFTGCTLEPTAYQGRQVLHLAQVFKVFPIALMEVGTEDG